ncbi:MAG TPA: hypothetical protein ENN66_04305 [Proteobacteria bacterium]|nr:hypothetical protein [Pseudomonadota bacterium]
MPESLPFAPYQLVEVAKILAGEKYQSHLLTRVGDTIIIDRPKRQAKSGGWRYFDSVYVNNLLYLNYEHKGFSYQFKTSVLKVSYIPFYHLCLKTPELREIKQVKIWSAPRYQSYTPVTLSGMHKDGYKVLLSPCSYVVDIGPQGVGILSRHRVPRNFLLEMSLAADSRLQIQCRLKNVKSGRPDGYYCYGCEIEKVSDPQGFAEYLEFLAAAADFFSKIPTDVGTDDFSFYTFV